MVVVVVAKYKEDTKWSDDLDSFVVQKEIHMDNWGREPSSFLWYIINHYDELEGYYAFVQGNPFDHCHNLISDVNKDPLTGFEWLGDTNYLTDENGSPYHTGLPVKHICDLLGLEVKYPIYFARGGQFLVHSNRIKFKPKGFYESCLQLIKELDQAEYVFERIWRELFR